MKVKAPFRMVAYMGGYLVKPANGYRTLQTISARTLNKVRKPADTREKGKSE